MCGIAGFVQRDGQRPDSHRLKAMTDSLAHRGPDGEGFVVRGMAALGHRRLAIIDLTTGAQPMSSEDERLWITFNGEIYNFLELRRELEQRGCTFRTSSDTEVILKAYEVYGTECLGHLRGMFAFALWDERRGRLFLARDRAGIKPVFYRWDGRRLLFASELKAILQDPDVPRELDWDALKEFLIFNYVPTPRTIFRGIRKLPPASYLVLDADRREPEIHRYWDLRLKPVETRPDAEWLEGLRWHLADAVKSHLISDVPIGAFLSGGVDSSTVVALMAQAVDRPIRTFSIGFDESDFDELKYAREVARRYGTDHYEYVVKPDALEAMPRLAEQFDEPFADSSALPTYYVSKITRDHVTVALSGDGGDENFAGYRRYQRAEALHARFDRFPGLPIRRLLRSAATMAPTSLRGRGYLALLGADGLERYFRLMTFQTTETLTALLGPAARAHLTPRVDASAFARIAREGAAPDYVATLQYLDVRTYLPDDILTKVDRTSMLVSLESRVPLLDHRLMEYVAGMPTRLKLAGGQGKAILKRAMSGHLPAAILNRRKMGFGVPLASWFRGELGTYATDVLLSRSARERGLTDPLAVRRLLEEHQSQGRDRSSILWTLLCLEEWARRWWDRR